MIRVLPTPNVAHGLAISAMPAPLAERSTLVCQWSRAADGRLICTWRLSAPDWLPPISGVDWTARTLRSSAALTARPAADLALT